MATRGIEKSSVTVFDRLAYMGKHGMGAPELPPVTAIDFLDEKAYITGKPRLPRRHKARDNLLRTTRFCPIIRRTEALQALLARQLGAKANEVVSQTGVHVVARA
jgi:hypothetical protein